MTARRWPGGEGFRIRAGFTFHTPCIHHNWNIPQDYKELDLVDYLIDKLYASDVDKFTVDFDNRAQRVSTELALYKKLNLENVLRTIIYIINTLESRKVVWGVGRGSSVSSYLLYLIGVHDVDSVAYDLDITDFLRT